MFWNKMLPIIPITPIVVTHTRKVEVPVIQWCAYTKKIESNLWKCVTEEEYQQEQEQKRLEQQKCNEMWIWECHKGLIIAWCIVIFLLIIVVLFLTM